MRHCDSGTPCSAHQSPDAWNAGISSALQRVHKDSGTECSSHQSSWLPGTALTGACSVEGVALSPEQEVARRIKERRLRVRDMDIS